MEEFEGVAPFVGFDEGEREVHGLCADALEVGALHGAFGVGPDDLGGEVVGLRVLIAHPRLEGERGDVVREVEAVVGGSPWRMASWKAAVTFLLWVLWNCMAVRLR